MTTTASPRPAESAGRVPRLVAATRPVHLPVRLDGDQHQVVSRRQGSGPLVVIGGPGTGTTTTLVEAVAARIERDGVGAHQVLLLAPTRLAAAALRDRVAARVRRTVREPLARSPHSYAFGLLRRSRVLDGDLPPQLISGAEQDRILGELLAGHLEAVGRVPEWPAGITEQVRALRGFRDELRDLLMRAVERGLPADELAQLGRVQGRPDWVAAADVLKEYLEVTSLATPGAFDPAGIVDAAVAVLEFDPELLEQQRRQWAVIAVDDAHEVTAATIRLLLLLASGGRDLILAGDPDSATQTFRGAQPRLLAAAADLFRRADGGPASRVLLTSVHRHPAALREVTARVAARIASSGVVAHRAARSVSPGSPGHSEPGAQIPGAQIPGAQVQVRLLASAAQEAGYVAAHLRRLHLERELAWEQMAVVVRSARATSVLRRALATAGVPVAVPAAELPVRDEPAARPLRLAMRACLHPELLDAELAVDLLTGPLGGADAVGLRRLRQYLRAAELADGGTRASDELLVENLQSTVEPPGLDPVVGAPVRRVLRVLNAGRQAVDDPAATAETVLWAIWAASGLAEGWRRAALAGGESGARADRDLDAVTALFEVAARYVDRLPHAGTAEFLDYLEGQDLPADSLAPRAPDGRAVALVTAAGAAGREWEAVAVVGVQEGVWPDLRLRSSLLGAQRLADLLDDRGGDGPAGDGPAGDGAAGDGAVRDDPVSVQRRAVLGDELRLFHVAVSRARRDLLVTAVRNLEELPSPFLDLVDPPGTVAQPGPADEAAGQGGPGEAAVQGGAGEAAGQGGPGAVAEPEQRPIAVVPRAMSLPALVAELRAVVVDPGAEAAQRAAAAQELARLAVAGVPGADPDDWYGLAPLSDEGPRRGPEQQVRVSPSKVELFDRCALRWVLEQSGAGSPASAAQGLGTLIHELAQELPAGGEAQLLELLTQRFDRLGLGQGWLARAERARAERMIAKLAEYVRRCRAEGRQVLAVERDVAVTLGRALVRGQVDRLEIDAQGRLVVVDLKTGKSKPTGAELERHAQLGVYQVLIEQGGFDQVEPGRASGGAFLVQLGGDTKKVGLQHQPPLVQGSDPRWAHELVEAVAEGMAGARYPATVNPGCRVCAVRRSCPAQTEGRQVGQG